MNDAKYKMRFSDQGLTELFNIAIYVKAACVDPERFEQMLDTNDKKRKVDAMATRFANAILQCRRNVERNERLGLEAKVE